MLALNSTHAQLVMEIAMGKDEPVDIAYRYGIVPEDFVVMEQQDWFRMAVLAKRADLEREGWPIKAKAAMMAETMMTHLFNLTKTSTDGLTFQLELLKYYAKLADLEPKQHTQGAPGSAFSITLDLRGSTARQNTLVSVQPAGASLAPLNAFVLDQLPAAPDYIASMPFERLPGE